MEHVKDNEIDLGLALGITNQHVESCSNRGAGANANANSSSRIDAIVGPRPLTELVWSTQNGLSIKCAGCCSSCFADMKPCILRDVVGTEVSPSQDRGKGVATCHVGPLKSAPASFLGSNLGHTGPKKQRSADLLPLLLANEPENIGDGIDRLDLDIGKMQDIRQSTCGEHDLMKEEGTAENDVVIVKDFLEREGEEDSSVESCNSASKRNRRWCFEQQLISGSKRIKKQSQEYPPVVKQHDSSFMNWISNMVKGVKPYQQEEGRHLLDDDDDDKTLQNVVSKRFGFQSVFQSLYSQDPKILEETKTHMESSSSKSSKEIILFDNQKAQAQDDDHFNHKALWITRLSPKPPPSTLITSNYIKPKDSPPTPSDFNKPVELTSSYEIYALKKSTPMEMITCFFCGKTGHESRDCLQINENKNVFLKKKVSNLNEVPNQIETNNLLNQEKILRIPKQIFDAIRRLRLSRTDILKWMNSRSAIANLDGYFLRLRLAKWEEGVGGAGYYVACITDENPSNGSKKPIRVHIGGVQCLVECRYISNCDFLEDELIYWWQTTLTSGRPVMEENLTSKLEERKKLGF